jgi:hypothetical protein
MPEIGEEVEITKACPKMGISVGQLVTVIEIDEDMIKFNHGNGMYCWTSYFRKKTQKCTCTLDILMATGCQCKGK